VPGSFARCRAGIEALVRHRVPLGLKSTLTLYNVGELEAMRQMAHNWELPFSAAWLLSKRRDRADSEVEDCRMSARECVALEAADQASASDWTETALRESDPGIDPIFYCQAGKAAFVINSRGEMNPCIDLTQPGARPLEIGFGAAWEKVQRFVDSAPPVSEECAACDARVYCPCCPAWSQLETGTLTQPVPYLCEIARERKKRYNKSVIISITIADIEIELISPLSDAELGIVQRLGPFSRATDKPLAHVTVRWNESLGPPVPRGKLIYDPGSIWKMYRDGDDCYAEISYHGEDETAQVQSVLRANPTWDALTLTEQRRGESWQSLLNLGAGELILRTAILFTGGLVFHSSGLDDNGRGIVFVGHSGAGKSTQLEIWSRETGVIAMNDDRIAVRVNEKGAVCYGTPWGGTADIAKNHAAPLCAIIVLEQASENAIEPILPSAAASLLAARAFLPYWDGTLMERAFANLNTILTYVPIYRLRCRPEPAVISLVRSVL
jgi:radical SAM protein with 4Fe4S-binding SPASM domain